MEGQSFNVFSIIIITKKDFKGGVRQARPFQARVVGLGSLEAARRKMRILEDLFSDFIFFSQGKEN